MKKLLISVAMGVLISGCATQTYIKVPEGSVLKIKRGTEQTYSEGKVKRTPFSWSSAGGIPYALEKDGNVVQEGRLRAKFRPASIFWPPAAILYWPIGFREPCYDLTQGSAQTCSSEVYNQLILEEQNKSGAE